MSAADAPPPDPPRLHLVESPEVIRLKKALELAHGEHERMAADILGLERDLKAKRSRITFLENELAERHRSDAFYGQALELFEFWRQHCRPKARTFSDDRLKNVLARLKEKREGSDEQAYSQRFIAKAILGAKYCAFVDRQGKRHDDLELICRNGRKLEDFADRYVQWRKKNGLPDLA
jgi:hypothetical protein